jgi:hypothetical protein
MLHAVQPARCTGVLTQIAVIYQAVGLDYACNKHSSVHAMSNVHTRLQADFQLQPHSCKLQNLLVLQVLHALIICEKVPAGSVSRGSLRHQKTNVAHDAR